MTETPSNKKGFLGNLDQTIQDTQAKTVDFFDNAFGGDKRTLEEIKENRQKNRFKCDLQFGRRKCSTNLIINVLGEKYGIPRQ